MIPQKNLHTTLSKEKFEDVTDMPESFERTTDILNANEKKFMVEMLDSLMVPGFPLDKRCLNKENKDKSVVVTTVAGTYLGESKTTFPVSEHLTPQQFLMQAGFSPFQAHSVCENRRIKGKLTAAIKEARVWLNCMTKNQALLIYGLSVKLMTKEMPHLFLQLTEAIANNRIQNMMQLFDYLRLMKTIGKLPLQSEFAEPIKNVLLKDSKKGKKKTTSSKKSAARATILTDTPLESDEIAEKSDEIALKPDEIALIPVEVQETTVSSPIYSTDQDKTEIVTPLKGTSKSSYRKKIKNTPSVIVPTKITQIHKTDSSSSVRSIATQTESRKKRPPISTQVMDKPLKIPKEVKRGKMISSKQAKTFPKKSKHSGSIKKIGTESSSSSEGVKEKKKTSAKKQTKKPTTSDHISKTKSQSSTKITKIKSRKLSEGAEGKILEKKSKRKSSSKEGKKQKLSSTESKPGYSKATREIGEKVSSSFEKAKKLPISDKLKRNEPPVSKGERKLKSLKKTPLITSDQKSREIDSSSSHESKGDSPSSSNGVKKKKPRKTDSSSSNERKGESSSSSKGVKRKKSSIPKKVTKRPSTSTQDVKKKNSKLIRRFKKK